MSEFEDKLYTSLYQVMRASGIGLSVKGMDQLNTASRDMAKLLKEKVVFEAGEIANKVQENMVESFKSVEKDDERLEDRVTALQEEVAKLYEERE